MLQKQKETIIELLKSDEAKGSFENKYWFPYEEFLNPLDEFTVFSCENLDGKRDYITLIETFLKADETAKIFVEVYGYEEDDNEQFIVADTLIIFSKISFDEIERIFNAPQDIFPSDIGKIVEFTQHNFIVDKNGELLSVEKLFENDSSAYYCWWD